MTPSTATTPTHPQARAVPTLLPQLLVAAHTQSGGLGTVGGSLEHRRATVALSSELSVGFVWGRRPVRHGDIESHGLSLHQGWEEACENLIAAATTRWGVKFSYRPATALAGPKAPTAAMQIACHGTKDPTRWLTHPRAFTLLHEHFSQLLGFPPCYLAPRGGMLVAASKTDVEHPALQRWAAAEAATGPRGLLPAALEYAHGFPRHIQRLATRV